jgi:hypothetical protein
MYYAGGTSQMFRPIKWRIRITATSQQVSCCHEIMMLYMNGNSDSILLVMYAEDSTVAFDVYGFTQGYLGR